jgi:hypothetical protein
MKTIFNFPAVPFAIFIIIAVAGMILFMPHGKLTGYAVSCALSSDNTICTNATRSYGPTCADSTSWKPYSCDGESCIASEIGWLCPGNKSVCYNGRCVAACTTVNGTCRALMMGGSSCKENETENSSLGCASGMQVCCTPGTASSDTCTPEGGWCSPYGTCYGDKPVKDATKTCPYGTCCMPAEPSITLDSPTEDDEIGLYENVTLKWTPENFLNSKPVCFPGMWMTEDNSTLFFSGYEDGEASLIKCNNTKTCSWTFYELDDEYYIGEWQWKVFCANSEADFEEESGENIAVSDIETFNVIPGEQIAGTPSWNCSAPWGACQSEGKQYRTCTGGNCSIKPSGGCASCSNSKCVQAKNCTYVAYGEEIPEVIENWGPYPCTTGQTQKRVSQYSNGTNITEARPCRLEDWNMVDCVDGSQVWEDKNNAGTEYTKPEAEPCEERDLLKQFMPWIWVIVIAIVVFLVIMFIVKGIKTRRAGIILGVKKPETKEAKQEAKEEYPELKSFIAKAKARGMSKDKIKKELLKSGWPQEVVDKSFE